MWHFFYAKYLNNHSQEKFFNKSPDLIAVFTGDKGRIRKALEISFQHPTSKILISGVYSKNNLKILLKSQFPKEVIGENFDFLSRVTELDFQAQNTFQNVEKTLEYIDQHHHFENTLIISSDYHLPRIRYLLWKLKKKNENSFKFYFQGIKTKKAGRWIYHTLLEQVKLIKEILS